MRQPLAVYLAATLPLCVVAYATGGAIQRAFQLAAALGAVGAIVVGVRLHRPRAPRAWYAMAATLVLWLLGDALHAWGPAWFGESRAHLAGGVTYLGAILLLTRAATIAARARSGQNVRSDLLRAAIATAPIVYVTWALLVEAPIEAWFRSGTGPFPLEQLYPLAHAFLLGAFIRLAQVPGAGRRVAAVPAAVLATILAADVLGLTEPPLLAGHPVTFDIRWLVGYLALGAAALHPAMTKVTEQGSRFRPPTHASQIVGLMAAMFTGPALLAWQDVHHEEVSGPASSAFSVVITLLVGARMLEMVRFINAQAATDDLTRLPNRRALQACADAHLVDRRTHRALLLLDLDRFKEVNDSLGHDTGDRLLVQVAGRLQSAVRPGDLLARLGGDEFAVLLDDVSRHEAEAVARTLLASLAQPFDLGDLTVHAHGSVGIALFPEHGTDLSTLLRRADAAMYRAKRQGRVHLHDAAEDDGSSDRLRLAEELRAGLDRHELVVHYQPKLELRSGEVCGVEALVRWQHPTRGLLPPGAFLERAEEVGLMPELTREVLQLALDQAGRWAADGRHLEVAVNLSTSSLLDADLPREIEAALAARDLAPSALRLEITEEVLMADRARAREVLVELRRGGVPIAVDDFGTGYSSLAYLRDLPIDELKLDRSFIAPIEHDPRSAALVSSVITLAHSLGLTMVAEGVEDEATLVLLAQLGADQAQGYHLTRPLPPADLEAWLDARTAVTAGAPRPRASARPTAAGVPATRRRPSR